MKCYVVTQEGVYRHAIAGVFLDALPAITCAEKSIKEEPDDYHSYEVTELDMNDDTTQEMTIYRISRAGFPDPEADVKALVRAAQRVLPLLLDTREEAVELRNALSRLRLRREP